MPVRGTAAVLTAALAVAAGVGLATSSGSSSVSPVHVAGVFADGFSHGDFRQVCSVIRRGSRFDMATCAANLAGGTGVTRVRVVPHSARVWTDSYRGRSVEYAFVGIDVSLSGFGTARYRLQMVLTGRGWLIRAITVPPGGKG